MIYLTEAAQQRVRRFVTAQTGAVGLRVSVKRSGCSGYGYEVEVIQDIATEDTVFDYPGFAVAVNKDDLPMLQGLRIDVLKNGLNESFVFDNPQAQSTCGCGTSFSV